MTFRLEQVRSTSQAMFCRFRVGGGFLAGIAHFRWSSSRPANQSSSIQTHTALFVLCELLSLSILLIIV
jgi:hypothetical protein